MSETLTIRQMCDAFEVTPRTLRFYESKELLAPIRVGQKRLFTRRDRARLKLILRAKRFGFSLEEIRQLLDLYKGDGGEAAQIRSAYQLGQQHLARMLKEREDLNQAISELEKELSTADERLAELYSAHAAE